MVWLPELMIILIIILEKDFGDCRCSKVTTQHNFSIYGRNSEENRRKIDEVVKLIDEYMNKISKTKGMG